MSSWTAELQRRQLMPAFAFMTNGCSRRTKTAKGTVTFLLNDVGDAWKGLKCYLKQRHAIFRTATSLVELLLSLVLKLPSDFIRNVVADAPL